MTDPDDPDSRLAPPRESTNFAALRGRLLGVSLEDAERMDAAGSRAEKIGILADCRGISRAEAAHILDGGPLGRLRSVPPPIEPSPEK